MRLKEIKPGMVIHCKTEEERFALINHIDNQGGFRWRYTGDSPATKDFCMPYLVVGDDCKITQSPTDNVGINVTEFYDLIIPELSANEVLEIIGEICETRPCSQCPFGTTTGNGCLASKRSARERTDEVIDICTKWREEHPKEEKKELETEWVYVVRIIKVHENGKKECVHEVDYGRNEQEEFSFVDYFADDQLKKYCSEHKGNFFAVYEHICRIKE